MFNLFCQTFTFLPNYVGPVNPVQLVFVRYRGVLRATGALHSYRVIGCKLAVTDSVERAYCVGSFASPAAAVAMARLVETGAANVAVVCPN